MTYRLVIGHCPFLMTAFSGHGVPTVGLVQTTRNLTVGCAGNRLRVDAETPGLIETNMTRGMKGVEALERPRLERTPRLESEIGGLERTRAEMP